MKTKFSIKQDELKSLLHYDAGTGVFRWRVRPCQALHAGSVAGGVSDKGYRKIRIKRVHFIASRLAWIYVFGDIPDGMEIDHIDGNPRNDAIGNLRLATCCQNIWNVGRRKNNTSGFKGVSFVKEDAKFRARIMVNRMSILLGDFHTARAAAEAYATAAAKFHGDFARTI